MAVCGRVDGRTPQEFGLEKWQVQKVRSERYFGANMDRSWM